MRQIKIEKDKLRDTLRTNREEHRNIFLKAQEKYRELAIEDLEFALRAARKGEKIRRHIERVEPQDYTKEYDTVLQQLDYEVDDVVTLNDQEFRNYVLDDWGWSDNFVATSSAYLGEHDSF